MAARGTDNLRCYLREAALPIMPTDPNAPVPPPQGHKSHLNFLSVRSETWRRLENIYTLKDLQMDKTITSWIDTEIPEESLGLEDEDAATGERLSVPCPPYFDVPSHHERRPRDIRRLIPWLDNLPLMTVQRALHLVFPETRPWGFTLNTELEKDSNIFQHFVWSPQNQDCTPRPGGRSRPKKSLVVAVQPPWILSEQDLKEFSECRTFPPFRVPGNAFTTSLDSKERLWAKLWDVCVRRDSPWFVVTSYNQWVFGAFSAGWTSAFVTEVVEYNSYSPTIVERLTFWVASAMAIPGCSRVPQVPEPLAHLSPVSIPKTRRADFANPADSESNWDGKSEDPSTSARAWSTLSSVASDITMDGLPTSVNPGIPSIERVQRWMQHNAQSLNFYTDNPPIDRRCDQLSMHQMHKYHGEWLA